MVPRRAPLAATLAAAILAAATLAAGAGPAEPSQPGAGCPVRMELAPHHLVSQANPLFVKDSQAENHAVIGWAAGMRGGACQRL